MIDMLNYACLPVPIVIFTEAEIYLPFSLF